VEVKSVAREGVVVALPGAGGYPTTPWNEPRQRKNVSTKSGEFQAGEECVQLLHLFNQEDWQQPLCIAEKWIKVRSK